MIIFPAIDIKNGNCVRLYKGDMNTAEKVAESLEPSFAGTSLSSIAASVTSYLEIDAWCDDLVFTEQSYIKLQDVMENAGFLETRVTYTAAVDNTYALAIAQ